MMTLAAAASALGVRTGGGDPRFESVSTDTRTLESGALFVALRGDRFDEGDLYVMINAHHEPRSFRVQEGDASDWFRVVDTSRPSPEDIAASGEEQPAGSLDQAVAARSVIVLSRRAPN